MNPAASKAETEITVCIGSNTPDSDLRILAAIEFLKEKSNGHDFVATDVFHCPGSSYGNALLRYYTAMPVGELQKLTKTYEKACGRTPEAKARGIITVDIDLVIAGGKILRDDYYSPYFTEGLRRLDAVVKDTELLSR